MIRGVCWGDAQGNSACEGRFFRTGQHSLIKRRIIFSPSVLMCQNRLIWSGEDPELRFLFAFEVPRLTVSNVCYLVFTDHHQSAAAVLRPAGQELPLLLREGEDSEYCRSAAAASSSSSARAPPCDGGSLRSLVLHSLGEGINILDPAAHFCASASVVSSSDPSSTCHRLAFHHVLFFFDVSLLFVLFCLPPSSSCSPVC